MKRLALVLLSSIALAGVATAADDDAKWRRIEAQAARYNASGWVRLESPQGRYLWVQAADAARLTTAGARPRKLTTLWPDSIEFVAHVGEGTRYVVEEATWACSRKAVTVHRYFFHADGSLLAERLPEPGEFSEDDITYQAACKGVRLKATRRWPSAAAVIANEPDEGSGPAE